MDFTKRKFLTARKRARQNLGAAALAVAVLARASAATAWPSFLPPPGTLSPGVVSAVERVLAEPTLNRRVEVAPARVPLATYIAFVDSPDATAAAARHLGVARYEVHMLDDEDWYEADDHDGARGVYRVLVRTATRRVMLSWGTHTGSILGTIGGSALTVLDLEARGEGTGQRLQAYVLIENRVAAALARILIPIFGYVADRKLDEGLRVTARVAQWAVERPAEFCAWLEREPLPPGPHQRLRAALACP